VAFDLAAMRGFIRFLIRDPSATAIGDADLLALYINPSWRDWFTRFERRPGANIAGFTYTANQATVDIGGSFQSSDRIEAVVLTAGDAQLVRQEWNAIRYLQESEGATGTPRTWAMMYLPNFELNFAFYPIPIVDTAFTLFLSAYDVSGGDLLADTDTVKTGPVSARWVARVAAYRAAIALKCPHRVCDSIMRGLPKWALSVIEMDRLQHARAANEEAEKLYRSQPVAA
jgi:hypothetical protein